ncbi:MAG: hypothetical protein OXE04_05690 [bacterium]|nr:hypothetical protein [bacterium]
MTLYVDTSGLMKRYIVEHDSEVAEHLMHSDSEQTLCRSLDSLHLAAATRAGASTTLLTFDIRQAQAARLLGMAVVGT